MPRGSTNESGLAEIVAARLIAFRQAAGMSQAEIAERVGITQASLSNYERARRDMHLQTAVRIAAVFGIEVPSLLATTDLPRDTYLLASRGPDYLGG